MSRVSGNGEGSVEDETIVFEENMASSELIVNIEYAKLVFQYQILRLAKRLILCLILTKPPKRNAVR